ncbi:hypothetical protein L6R21_16120 [bacterium]|nr:hypothetical protein [bacterium]
MESSRDSCRSAFQQSGQLFSKSSQRGFGFVFAHTGKRLAVFGARLYLFQPIVLLPGARLHNYRKNPHALLPPALQQQGDFFFHDEFGSEKRRRNQQNRHIGRLQRIFNFRQPLVAALNFSVIPNFQRDLIFQYAKLGDETFFPGLVFVAVADKNFVHKATPE